MGPHQLVNIYTTSLLNRRHCQHCKLTPSHIELISKTLTKPLTPYVNNHSFLPTFSPYKKQGYGVFV